ncbi:MAG: hypothetical protein PHD88_04455 [Firmicutes bacterium]|nr:hypothetical protein [Bacillota bacterium]MDD4264169.1 hypothetical protein [Bacillota bacterium]MDD4693643.1 hypothetical protein [Bacillota bacterium]
MKRYVGVILVLVLVCVGVFADDLRFIRDDVPNKHVVGPNGIYMMLSHYNRNISNPSVQGYECELQVFTPEFKDKIVIFPDAFVNVFIVKGDVITEIITTALTAPKVPTEGYIIVGHGRAAVGFMAEFMVGDKVTIRDYTPKFTDKEYKEFVIMPDGSEVRINGWNRARCADDIVAYNADYADRTYTNEWGFEFSVERDEIWETRAVTALDYMEIPKDGYVVSAHGSMIGQISMVYPGDFVELD